MARAYASAVIEAPVEAVWAIVRDFGKLPDWLPGLRPATIEEGLAPDVVGCVRSFETEAGQPVRERLTMLDDTRYRFSYNFETPAFPVRDYHATFRLEPVTVGEHCFAEWSATFVEAPEDTGTYERIISEQVFTAGLASLAEKARGAAGGGEARWLGARPAKVFVSAVLPASVEKVWARVRDFAALSSWHPDIEGMAMLDGARPDKVSGVRRFRLGANELDEQLTVLCDVTHSLRYRITKSPTPWVNYHAGFRLWPVTADGTTFAVWTADWVADANDDLRLIPMVADDVFGRAFATLAEQLSAEGRAA